MTEQTAHTVSQRPTQNAFELVTVASSRARQLLKGCRPRVDGSPKLARRALQEVSAGIITRAEPADEAEG